jgi:hypothetical protein
VHLGFDHRLRLANALAAADAVAYESSEGRGVLARDLEVDVDVATDLHRMGAVRQPVRIISSGASRHAWASTG